MSGPNHVAGGLVFTGIFASFLDINIFSQIDYIIWTVFCCLLPDIDHRKSLIGKAFYPIAKFLDKRFGHRTITHSLMFLVLSFLVVAFIESIFSNNLNYAYILVFGLVSHFVLDMITIQGIPLFYPFYRNPCVIPANPSLRIRSSNRKIESIAFMMFILLGFSCSNLFKNGFWTSFNRSFGTIKHVANEFQNSSFFIKTEYDYNQNNIAKKGTALVVSATPEELVLLENNKLKVISKKDKTIHINDLLPFKTKTPKKYSEISFFNVDKDSLNTLIQNKIISGQIQSNKPFEIMVSNIKKTTKLYKFNTVINPMLVQVSDTSKTEILQKIKLKQIKIQEQRRKHNSLFSENSKIKMELDSLKTTISTTDDLVRKEELLKILFERKKDLKQVKKYQPDPIILEEIAQLKKQLNEDDNIIFSGNFSYPLL